MNPTRVAALLAATTLAAGLSATATAAPGPGPEFRLRAGLVMSGFDIFGSSSGSLSGSGFGGGGFGDPGFTIGAGVRLPLSGKFSLQLEAFYERRIGVLGFTFRPAFLPPNFGLSGATIRTTIDYIEVPITARYDLQIDYVRPYFFAGAALALRTSASADSAGRGILDRIGAGTIDEVVHTTNVAIVLGTGLEFDESRWGVELRASIGLTDVFVSPWANGQKLESSVNSRAFMLLVGYRF